MKLLTRALAAVRALTGVEAENNGATGLSRSTALRMQIEALEMQREVAEDLGEEGSLPNIDGQLSEMRLALSYEQEAEEQQARRRARASNPHRAARILIPVPVSWLLDIKKEKPIAESDSESEKGGK